MDARGTLTFKRVAVREEGSDDKGGRTGVTNPVHPVPPSVHPALLHSTPRHNALLRVCLTHTFSVVKFLLVGRQGKNYSQLDYKGRRSSSL